VALAEIEAAGFYANRAHHYAGICRALMRHMNWADRTSRPGHLGMAVAVGVDTRTVARCVRWLAERGLLGVVSQGTTAAVRPGVLYLGTGNLAAVYVLTVPKRRSRTCPAIAGQRDFVHLTSNRRLMVSGPRARQAKPTVKTRKARPPGGQPMLPPAGSALHHCPQNRSEGLTAAEAVQKRARDLRRLSPEYVRWLGRPFFTAGWTPADVVHAIDHSPTGRPHGYVTGIRSPAGWARGRLALWLGSDGLPLPSRSQVLADAHQRDVAEMERLRAQRQDPPARVAAEGAARAREALRQALAQASAASHRRSSGPGVATPPLPSRPAAPPPPAPDPPARAG
jgi:hypothetical protein